MNYITTVDGRDFAISIDSDGQIRVDDQELNVDLQAIGDSEVYSVLLENRSLEAFVERREGVYYIMIGGDLYAAEVEDARLKRLKAMGGAAHADAGGAQITAPMPGLVVKLLVDPGTEVSANQGLIILEAMKMENEIRSPKNGVVSRVSVEAGSTVDQGDLLIVVDDLEEAEDA